MSAPTPSPGSGEWVGSVDFPTRGNQFRVPLLRSQLGACPEQTSPSLCFGRSHLLLLPSSLLCLSGVSSGGLAGEIGPPQLFPKLLGAVLRLAISALLVEIAGNPAGSTWTWEAWEGV